jgi:hypothetical protein
VDITAEIAAMSVIATTTAPEAITAPDSSARTEGRSTMGIERDPHIAAGEDLDKIARDWGLVTHRRMDENGGIPDLITGIPMETDASLRKRILSRILGEDIIEGEIVSNALTRPAPHQE